MSDNSTWTIWDMVNDMQITYEQKEFTIALLCVLIGKDPEDIPEVRCMLSGQPLPDKGEPPCPVPDIVWGEDD